MNLEGKYRSRVERISERISNLEVKVRRLSCIWDKTGELRRRCRGGCPGLRIIASAGGISAASRIFI